MKVIKKASVDEMIASFLKTEIYSKRFSSNLLNIVRDRNANIKIIKKPDIKNENENIARKGILSDYRGYEKNQYIFRQFPENVDWYWAKLTKEELQKVKYINYNYWVELSSGSRLAIDAVKKIKAGIEVFDKSNDDFIKASLAVKRGKRFGPLIIVAPEEEKDNMVLLEGHLRLTAYILSIKNINDIKVLIGYSPKLELEKWYLF